MGLNLDSLADAVAASDVCKALAEVGITVVTVTTGAAPAAVLMGYHSNHLQLTAVDKRSMAGRLVQHQQAVRTGLFIKWSLIKSGSARSSMSSSSSTAAATAAAAPAYSTPTATAGAAEPAVTAVTAAATPQGAALPMPTMSTINRLRMMCLLRGRYTSSKSVKVSVSGPLLASYYHPLKLFPGVGIISCCPRGHHSMEARFSSSQTSCSHASTST